jgi:hypothetical protein
MRRLGRRSLRRTAREEYRRPRRQACRDCSHSRPAHCRRHVGCQWRSHSLRICSDARLPIAARRFRPVPRPRRQVRSLAARVAARSLRRMCVSTHRTVGHPCPIPSTIDCQCRSLPVRPSHPGQGRAGQPALNENLSLNTRDLARALLGVISRGRHRSLSEFRALRPDARRFHGAVPLMRPVDPRSRPSIRAIAQAGSDPGSGRVNSRPDRGALA